MPNMAGAEREQSRRAWECLSRAASQLGEAQIKGGGETEEEEEARRHITKTNKRDANWRRKCDRMMPIRTIKHLQIINLLIKK